MRAELAGVVLAAGKGTRMRPITDRVPKPLLTVDNVPLLQLALDRVGELTDSVAVNAHHLADQILAAAPRMRPGVHLSLEEGEILGTAGALVKLRDWIDGRAVVVANSDTLLAGPARGDTVLAGPARGDTVLAGPARGDTVLAGPARGDTVLAGPARGDTHLPGSVAALTEGWDGRRPRLLVADMGRPADFGTYRFLGLSTLPGPVAAALQPQPSGLYSAVWKHAELEFVVHTGPAFDCGTAAEFLTANLFASGGTSVIAPDAVVQGTVERSVVLSGGVVGPDEHLVDAIRDRFGQTLFG